MELDFVCGMEVDGEKAREQQLRTQYNNCTYHFCSVECKQQFDRNPSAYADLNFGEDEGEDLYTY